MRSGSSHPSFDIPEFALPVLKPYLLVLLEWLSLFSGYSLESLLFLLVSATFRHFSYIHCPAQGGEYSTSHVTSIENLCWRRAFNSWGVPPFRVSFKPVLTCIFHFTEQILHVLNLFLCPRVPGAVVS